MPSSLSAKQESTINVQLSICNLSDCLILTIHHRLVLHLSKPVNKSTCLFELPVLSTSVANRRPDQKNMQNAAEASEEHQSDPFAELVQAIHQSLPSTTPTPSLTASASPMARPATYTGEAEDCSAFLQQFSLYFEMQPQQLITDQVKIAGTCNFRTCTQLSPLSSYQLLYNVHRPFYGSFWPSLTVHDQLFRF